jgi:hypothetical protein
MKIRSSSLPKLAVCGQFEGAQGEPSEAAARGLKLDAALRAAWTTGNVPELDQTDGIAVAWSYGVLDFLARSYEGAEAVVYPVEMREKRCKIWVPLIDYTGTADAICAKGRWIADLKSGQIRNYREQMAAYCLGLMTEHLEMEWTYHLIFCDAEQTVSETLTFAQARDIVQGVIDNVGTAPTPNDYCGWCAKSLTCSARVTALDVVDTRFDAVLADPDKLGLFLDKCRILDDFREAAADKAREILDAGGTIPGWRLQKGRVSEAVDVATQLQFCDPEQLLVAHGALSAKKFRELVGEGIEFPIVRKISKPSLVKTK